MIWIFSLYAAKLAMPFAQAPIGRTKLEADVRMCECAHACVQNLTHHVHAWSLNVCMSLHLTEY